MGLAISIVIVALIAAAALCALLLRSFRQIFLVAPGARSSHVNATPQGGGLVVVPVALVLAFAASIAGGARPDAFAWSLTGAMLALMLVGAWDDRAPLTPLVRLAVQAAAAALALAASPLDLVGWLAALPAPLAWGGAYIGTLWFINLTNFMDGLDLMTVAQFVPALATLCWLAAAPDGPAPWIGLLCLSTAGALLGFALLNKPPARLFLGDSGSLPLGLLGASAALVVAASRGPFVALLPFLYYFADATLTLARRVFAGQKFWQAHREHFYQRATRRGLSSPRVVARVAACNILLCALAVLIAGQRAPLQLAGLALGVAAVVALMGDLTRERA